MNSPIALESLLQRGRTPLFNELVSVYQESFDALIESPRASGKEVNLTLKSLGFIEKIKRVIENHTNLKINYIRIMESIEPNASMSITESLTRTKELRKIKSSHGVLIEKIGSLYNDKTGVLNRSSLIDLGLILTLRVSTAFWTIKNDDGSFYFSPEDVAATTLHEVGHIDYFIRQYERIYFDIIDASEVVEYLKQSPSRTDCLKIIDHIEKLSILDKSWRPLLNTCKEYFSTSYSEASSEHIEAINTLSLLVITGSSNYTLSKFNRSFRDYRKLGIFGTSRVGIKDYYLDEERSADEYSVRNGSYQFLVSALVKMHNLAIFDEQRMMAQKDMYKQKMIIVILKQFKQNTDYNAEDLLYGYDPIIRRLELVVETAKHSFSDESLPPDIKLEIKNQIVEAEIYIREYKSKLREDFRKDLISWKSNILKYARLIALPWSNKIQSDYDRLQESTRHLSRNPLHYIAKS